MAIRELSIDELEASGDKGSVWILNSAARSVHQLEGELLINIPNAQGKAELLRVAQSWLPQNATARFTKRRLMESTEFRNAVVEGLVTLIDEKTAGLILKEDGSKEEQQRLAKLANHVKEQGSARKISDAKVDIINDNQINSGNTTPTEVFNSDQTQAIKAGATSANGMSPNFMAFFEKMKSQDDVSALNSIKSRNSFSRKELRFLRDNLPAHPKTTKVLRSRLVELKKASEASKA